jgi:CBS domain containing-hemolysin-like protein
MIIWNLVVIVVLIGLNGFFVAVEFAAVASRRARLDTLIESDNRSSKVVKNWLQNPGERDRLIAATQLGITVVSLALGAIGENTFEEMLTPLFKDNGVYSSFAIINIILPALPLTLSLIIVTSLHVVLGEQVPKVAVLQKPERFALFAAPIMQVFGKIFGGFVSLLDGATHLILQLIGVQHEREHATVFTLEEIKQIVSGPEVEGVIEQPEREMLSAIFDFGELVVRQVMVPRTEIVAVEADEPLQTVIDLSSKHTVTKFPVYEDNLDQIIGIIYIKDLLPLFRDPHKAKNTVRSLVRDALFVPETISVNNLLYQFRARRQHIAIVLDEYGGTAGLVTLEDLMEEIIGEVSDIFDATLPSIQHLPDGTAIIDGLTLIEDINNHFGLNLYDENYDTIAGYLLGKLNRIPKIGDSFEDSDAGIRLKVEAMDRLRISKLSLSRL